MVGERAPINRKHCGPQEATCAVCGREIGAYESRWFGDAGAVHQWHADKVAEFAGCLTEENKSKYPHYYTDG